MTTETTIEHQTGRADVVVLPLEIPGQLTPAYGQSFWFSYLANSSLMVAITLLYRYADFVTYLGGTELDLGWIVGVGMTGSLAMRFAQGASIDRYGPRKIWLISLVLFVASMLGHLAITSVSGPLIYALRIAFSTSIAGAFGASITAVSRRMPIARMAEVIGMLGTSGFIAMALGPTLGDVLLGAPGAGGTNLYWMFAIAALLGMCSLACAMLATRGDRRPRARRRPPVLWLIRRYHPGPVLVMGMAVGIGVALPTTFLPTYAAQLGLERIGVFFTFYAITAFMTRLLTRRFLQRFGVEPMMYCGIASLVMSLVLYLIVRHTWQLIFPGFFAGIAHAFLFPSVVATGSTAFPSRYRGLGTTVMLAMFDLGTLVGAPLAGIILHYSSTAGLAPYPTMFLTIAVLMAACGSYYAIARHGRGGAS